MGPAVAAREPPVPTRTSGALSRGVDAVAGQLSAAVEVTKRTLQMYLFFSSLWFR